VKQKFHLKKLGFYLSHLGVVVILAGAMIGFIWSKKISFGSYIGDQYANDSIYDLKAQNPEPVNLGFSYFVTDFKVEKFDPVFSLLMMPDEPGNNPIKIKDYNLDNGKVVLDDSMGTFTESDLRDSAGQWVPHIRLKGKYVLFTNKPANKWYSANVHIKDGTKEKTFQLAVNHPVSYNKWRFYLMDYGQDRQGQYILMTGRSDPGRIVVITGIWMLIIGIFMICLIRKNRKLVKA